MDNFTKHKSLISEEWSPVYSPIYYYHFLPSNNKLPFQIPYLAVNPFYKSHKCNKLEKLINKERKKKGLKALKCDYGLYYVAWWHTKVGDEAG